MATRFSAGVHPSVGAHFLRLHLRPRWTPIGFSVGHPILGAHFAHNDGCPYKGLCGCPIARLGSRPTSGVQPSPHPAATWPHYVRPSPTIWTAMLGHHLRPLGSTSSVHLPPHHPSTWTHYPRPPSSTSWAQLGFHLPPRSAPTRVHLAVQHSRLGAATSCGLPISMRG